MIKEDYVSFETAKLLNEKGFKQECDYATSWYAKQYYKNSCQGEWFEGEHQIIEDIDDKCNISYLSDKNIFIPAPTLQMAMKWLREEHNLHCDIGYDDLDWFWNIISVSEDIPPEERPKLIKDGYAANKTYEEACEAAIKYCLTNLVE